MTDEFRDLFGLPLPVARGAGRPVFEWSEEKSNRVNILFACGYEPKDVAPVIGCCLKTFRKVFSRECADWRNARIKFRSTQMLRLNDQAEAGNVTAEKALAGMIQAEQIKVTSARFGDKPRRAKPKGIKDQRIDAAWDAGKGDDDWADLLGQGTGPAPLPN